MSTFDPGVDGPGRPAPIAELVAFYDDGPTRSRIARYKGFLRSRLIGLGITVVLLVVIGIWQHRNLASAAGITIYALVVAVAVATVVLTYLLYRRSLRPLATLGQGVALRIDRHGVELAGQGVGWAEVAELAVRRSGWGFSPDFELLRRDQTSLRLPLDQIGALPATVDTAARAYSGGRHGVDLNALDN